MPTKQQQSNAKTDSKAAEEVAATEPKTEREYEPDPHKATMATSPYAGGYPPAPDAVLLQARLNEQERRKQANRKHCSEVLQAALKEDAVKVGEKTDRYTGKSEDITIPVPRKLPNGTDPMKSDRIAMEAFIKEYLIKARNCARSEALNQCEQAFGYNYRV